MRSTWRIETKLALQQPHLNHVVPKRLNYGRINLHIRLEKHKVDQMVERNIRISLDKLSRSKATASLKESVRGQL